MSTVSARHDLTERRIAWELVRRGPMSRADLGRALGLSAPSVTRVVRPLIDQGVLHQAAALRRGVGRPSLPLDLVADREAVVGVHHDGDELASAVTDLKGKVLAHSRVRADLSTPERATEAVAALVRTWQDDATLPPVSALGVCLRARVDSLGVVRCDIPLADRNVTSPWARVRYQEMLEKATGLPTSCANDVHAVALGEHWLGAGRGLTDLAIITWDAEVGFALVANDDLIWGHQGGSGRVREVRLPDTRRVTDVLALNAVFQRVSAISRQRVDSVDQVLSLAAQDVGVAEVVNEVVEALGQWASMITITTHPQRLLVCGQGVGLVADRLPELEARLNPPMAPCLEPVEVHLASLDAQAWARGAAVVGIRRLVRT